jgi:spore coat polysaccharide biosynthesis protein SpsF
MKVLAITQARTGSSRLPRKVLKTIAGIPLLTLHLERILRAKKINQLVVATTTDDHDNEIAELVSGMKLPVYRGSMENVLDRFYQAAKAYEPEWVVRLTADCPLIDPVLIDQIIDMALANNVDYCSNTLNPTFPDGMDVEVFKFSALEKAWKEAISTSDKEHVTPYIHQNSSFYHKQPFTSLNFAHPVDYASVRLTVDEINDYEVIKILIEKNGLNRDWKTYADCYRQDDEIKAINQHIRRNEGYNKTLKNNL